MPLLELATRNPVAGAAIFVRYVNEGICQDRVERERSAVSFQEGEFKITLKHRNEAVACINGAGSVDTFELGRLPAGDYSVVAEYESLPQAVYPFQATATQQRLSFSVEEGSVGASRPLWDFSGTYWSQDDSGWSLVIDQQPNKQLVALWSTFDDQGRAKWFYLLPGQWEAVNEYRAELAEAIGGPYYGRMPVNGVVPTMLPTQRKVGVAVFRFSRIAPDIGSGSFEYSVDGVSTFRTIRKFGLSTLP